MPVQKAGPTHLMADTVTCGGWLGTEYSACETPLILTPVTFAPAPRKRKRLPSEPGHSLLPYRCSQEGRRLAGRAEG